VSRRQVLPVVLLVLTGLTGMVDAESFLSFGHVFTANMTGNVVFIAFAFAGVPAFRWHAPERRSSDSLPAWRWARA
jgi:uncharacterized membrane protein YoaK (UPF0700 family)